MFREVSHLTFPENGDEDVLAVGRWMSDADLVGGRRSTEGSRQPAGTHRSPWPPPPLPAARFGKHGDSEGENGEGAMWAQAVFRSAAGRGLAAGCQLLWARTLRCNGFSGLGKRTGSGRVAACPCGAAAHDGHRNVQVNVCFLKLCPGRGSYFVLKLDVPVKCKSFFLPCLQQLISLELSHFSAFLKF